MPGDSVPEALGGYQSARHWVIQHDDSWLFIGAYVALAVVLSIYSLFWLLVVVGVHFALELGRQAARFDTRREVVAEAVWEVKLDLGLTVLALALTLYLPVVFGVLGLSSARAAAGTRAAASAKRATKGAHAVRGAKSASKLEKVVRAVLMNVDEAVLLLRGFVGGKAAKETTEATGEELTREDNAATRQDETDESQELEIERPDETSWSRSWGKWSWASIMVLVVSTLLILGAPLLPRYTPELVVEKILLEMEPFP